MRFVGSAAVATGTVNLSERLLVSFARHFPIRRGKLRIVDRLWRPAIGAAGTQRMARLKYGGFVMPCDLEELLQRQFYFFGTYFLEESILNAWRHAAAGAQVILDIGANAGIYSLAALAAEPSAAVHAFEPTPEIALRLRTTAKLNRLDRLHIHEVAISSAKGYARLERCRGDGGTNGGMNFIGASASEDEPDCVPTVRLDDFCREHAIGHIDLMKLDVQGHEYQALAGAERLIGDRRVGTVFLELNWLDDPRAPCPARDSIRLLERCGYQFSAATDDPQWRQPGDWMRDLTDVIARPASRS